VLVGHPTLHTRRARPRGQAGAELAPLARPLAAGLLT
jgi:hypothetical protein